MASSLFIAGHFQDALVYLSSIKEYCQGSDAFAWNHGIALASLGRWGEAEEALSTLTRPEWRADPVFAGWLARCYIQTGASAGSNTRSHWLEIEMNDDFIAAARTRQIPGCEPDTQKF